MRDFFKHAVFFVLMSIVFSSLTGCSNSSTAPSANGNAPQPNSVAAPANSGNQASSTGKATSNEYPPMAQPVMQADLEKVEGGTFKLEDKKGKVVLINLWGIWCQPCIKEMPHLIELQNQYRDRGFEIIGLNIGDQNSEKEPAENIRKFSEKMNLNYQLGYAEDKVYNDLLKISKFGGVPQSFLIDREGKLNGVYVGASTVELARMKDSIKKLVETN